MRDKCIMGTNGPLTTDVMHNMMDTIVPGQTSPAAPESPPKVGALNMATVVPDKAVTVDVDESVAMEQQQLQQVPVECNSDIKDENTESVKSSAPTSSLLLMKSEENDMISDVESFDGKIVYNPDGSAYIIEGDTDLSDTDSLMEFRQQEGSIVETKSRTIAPLIPVYPQIANAFYVQRNPGIFCNAFYNNMSSPYTEQQRSAFPEAPIMHSYRVYDLRSGKRETSEAANGAGTSQKQSVDSKNRVSNHPQTVPTKPILMCFLCKLSFGFAKSFVAHAISEHGMTLNDKENKIMSGCNASAIIQAFGKDKEPLLSFLEPNVLSEQKNASDDNHKQSPLETSAIENEASSPSQETASPSNTMNCNIPVPLVVAEENDAQEVVGDEVKNNVESMDIDEEQKIKNNNNLPPVLDEAKIAPHSMSSSSDMPQTTGVNTSLPIPLSHPFSQIPANSMVPSLAQMFATCDEHPQGKDQGVECPKCDMILGSSRSLGGHMTMMHSRNSCKTLKCPKCNWHYKYQETLEIHMKEKHPDNDAQCMYCITNQPHPRLARGETYTCGYKPYRCDVCNYSTTTKGNLSIHMQSDKHINNMQELQNGTQEMKLPPVTTCPQPPITPPAAVDINVNKKSLKPKPTWRCDVCNYETNVARNLRIHMTSEKHTHNMMVLQQNVKHMQRDMQLMNHMAMFDASMMGVPTPVNPNALPPGFPYDQSMFVPASLQNGPAIDSPVDLTKAIENDHPGVNSDGKNEASKTYQCCICNSFMTDSIESLHQHMQLDRSKSRPDDNVMISQGNYMCQLCQYKTNLKANFQLHCKTDKHLQRLQLVNHIKEGGQGNEWRIKYMNMSNPVQIKCTCCDYFTNSIHKLQLHASNPRHEICAKLYAHLRRGEKTAKSDRVYYHCSLCNYSTKTRLNLIQHVRTMKHLRNESLRQMQMQDQGKMLDEVIADIFSIKEYSENDNISFEEGDGELVDEEVGEFAVMPDGSMKENMGPETPKSISGLELAETRRKLGLFYPSDPRLSFRAPDNSNSASEQVHVCPYCNYSSISELRIQAHIQTQHMQMGGRGFLCPLCQEKYTEKSKLERHLMASHNVSSDAVQRLMVMVDQTELFNNVSNQQQPKSPGTPGAVEHPADANNVQVDQENNDNSSDVSDAEAIRINNDEDGAILNEKGEYEEQYRCTTCSKTFSKIDDLYAHQNELGHLELKQTPRGPGYLCWKRGCNQYFKTAQALQVHFREIHAKRQQLAISERHVYKYRCNQCSLAFKTLEKLQTHSQYHTIRNATKCNMCGRSFRTLAALKKHVETTHFETMTDNEIAEYHASLALNPLNLIENNCNSPSLDKENLEVSEGEAKGRADEPGLSDTASEKSNSILEDDQITQEYADVDDPDINSQHFAEDYINSQAIAEDSYNDPTRKFKCHRCKVAFTKQNYLTSHNKTLLHRKGDRFNYPLEKYLDPNRPYKCDVCKESFTQKNILLVHYNSVSHLHKLKQVGQTGHGTSSPPLNNISPPSSSVAVSSQPTPVPSPVFTTSSATAVSTTTVDGKPYKCNICKVAYSQGSTLDIHMRSVLHQTRASKLQELAMTGQVDISQPLIEQPEPQKAHSHNAAQQQHKKILADMLQQKQQFPMSSSPINHPPVLFQPIVSMGTPVTQPLSLVTTNPMTPLSAFSPSPSPSQTPQPSTSQPMYSCNRCNSIFVSAENLSQHQQMYCYFQAPGINLQYPYSFVPRRAKTQVHKNLLANFGFECVMHFNELNQIVKTDEVEDVKNENDAAEENGDVKMEVNTDKMIKTEDQDSEKKVDDTLKENNDVKDDDKKRENLIDLPEVSREKCKICQKQFSSIWVLKAHQEEVHRNLVPTSLVEICSENIKDDLLKKLPPIQTIDSVTQSQATPPIPSQPHTPNSDISINIKSENNPIVSSAMDLSQMSPLSLVNMMPISLNMPMAMALQPPLNAMMMPTLSLDSSFPPPAMMDPNFIAVQKMQQHQQAQANSQKRARTRISDEQLKILRAHFDINNSPSEEQIIAMSEQSGLPQKVIKHWFRNTLFKERQRNKDSPYNFNNPPSTTLNLEEYEKTGKITMSESDGNDNESTKSSETSDVKEERLAQQAESEKVKHRHHDIALAASSFHQHQQEATRVQMQLEFEQVQKEQQQVMEAVKQQLAEAQQAAVAAVAAEAQRQKEFRENRERQIEDIIASSVAHTMGGNFHNAPGTPLMNPASLQGFVDRTPSTSASESSQPPTPVSSSGAGSRRANRTRFTDYQLKVLQEYFEQNAYPKDDDLEHLSKLLNLSPRVIVVWFQNARQKARKVYENQPPIETPSPTEENSHRFHRTPGLNYQCKKCLTVFQRYYELIKHQKKHCFKDEDISPSQVFSGLDSNVPHSNESNPLVLNSNSTKNEEIRSSVKQEPVPSFNCEKCNLSFTRFDLWQEHQSIHMMNPSIFPSFPAESAFGLLQNIAQQSAQQQHNSQLDDDDDDDKFLKRKLSDDEDDKDEQPRDKRLRTTILPEQLDYLYQKYQIDCNPSRKQLETIAQEVGLKKRVVQVWFQNTRARERKGQYRAHQQLIHKRCPFCRALFRAKSALESHLATKHPEEMAKGDINVDNIPDDIPEGPNSLPPNSPGLDMAKLMANPFNVQPFMPFMPPNALGMPHVADPMHLQMKRMYEDSMKRYMDDMNQRPPSSEPSQTSTTPKPSTSSRTTDDAPLDLSKPVRVNIDERYPHGPFTTLSERSCDDLNSSRMSYDESVSDNHSEGDVNDFNEDSNHSDVTSPSNGFHHPSGSAASSSSLHNMQQNSVPKRFRTQMTSVQVKVMKYLFLDYKTPTMAECEMLGREIGLPKRVIQVWFQNARAKEKKAKLGYGKPFGTEPLPEQNLPPDDCKLCNFKYTHKYSIQDHIFTKKHIDNVQKHVQIEVSNERDMTDPSTLARQQQSRESGGQTTPKLGNEGTTSTHLAQLQAMGIQAAMGLPAHMGGFHSNADSGNGSAFSDAKDHKKDTVSSSASSKSDQKDENSKKEKMNPLLQAGLPPQMMSPFGPMFPGADGNFLPIMYPAAMPGFFPGLGMPMMQPAIFPGAENFMSYDPTRFGTPLSLLQIPPRAIRSVTAKLSEPSETKAQYTQDCKSISDLKTLVNTASFANVKESIVDVGYICKKCHMVYPAKDACIGHQQLMCYPGKNISELKTIVKLEQVQYKCGACNESFSTIQDFKCHCDSDTHITKLNSIPSKMEVD